MNGQIEIIGKPSSIIDYNLNEQYVTVKKIIISNDEILDSFEDKGVRNIFEKLSNSSKENYPTELKEAIDSGILDSTINPDFYKEITKKLSVISDNMMDIQIQGYNFMNSVSNSKFNITLRCESYSITKYYEEKGSFLSAIRSLICDYLEFSGNKSRISKLKNFQIEIYESEEIYKHIYLKKDGSSLILGANFGFDKTSPIDHSSGYEFYYSKGEGFSFFQNSQVSAILKEQSKLVETPIQTRNKILSDDELISINNATKHITDAVIELYLTRKGRLKILNVSILENTIYSGTDNGFFINKSSKNYDKISLITMRDEITESLPNPKYLLLKNHSEIQSLLSDFAIFDHLDGIILTENFYAPILDNIGQKKDLDIIYYKNDLSKSLEINFDQQKILIGNENQNIKNNPFNNILDETVKKDERLERLKNLNLETPKLNQTSRQQEQQQINKLTESMIASENSTMNQYNPNTNMTPGQNESGKRLSALDMLANAALNRETPKPTQPQQPQTPNPHQQNPMSNPTPSTPQPIQSQSNQKMSAMDLLMQATENKPTQPQQPQTPTPQQNTISNPISTPSQPQELQVSQMQSPFEQPMVNPLEEQSQLEPELGKQDHFSMYDNNLENTNQQPSEELKNEMLNREIIEEVADDILQEETSMPIQYQEETFQTPKQEYQEVDLSQETQVPQMQSPFEQPMANPLVETELPEELVSDINQIQETYEQPQQIETSNIDISRYENILATKIITLPQIQSNCYFVDSSNINQIQNSGELFFLSPTEENLTNDSLKYILPLGVSEGYNDSHYYILNSTNDYFLLENDSKINLFINLSYIENNLKKNFLEKALKHAKEKYVVITKQDLHLLENYIDKITGIFIKDIDSQEELNQIENTILLFEKKFLLHKNN